MCYCVETINETRLVKARKDYKDSNREFIMEHLSDLRKHYIGNGMPFAKWRLIAESIRDMWVIKKGSLHEYAVLKHEGQIYQWRTKPGLDDICRQFDLWPEC